MNKLISMNWALQKVENPINRLNETEYMSLTEKARDRGLLLPGFAAI